jgi:RimJ/RimL family protein N-acetyltransferase
MIENVLQERYPRTYRGKTGEEFILRPLQASDEAALLEFFRALPQEDRLLLKDDVTDAAVIRRWCADIDYDLNLPLLALAGGAIVADATLHQQRSGWMSHVAKLRVTVHPAYRQRGLATELLKDLLSLAGDAGLEMVDAEFFAEQTGAMKVFQSMGFARVATLQRHVRDRFNRSHDLVIMTAELRNLEYFAAG